MKKHMTSGKCPRCGGQLMTSDLEGYSFVCEECDENFFTIEVVENMADLHEINVKMSREEFTRGLPVFDKLTDKYGACFLGHDDGCNLTDIGWEDGFPMSDKLNAFVKELETVRVIAAVDDALEKHDADNVDVVKEEDEKLNIIYHSDNNSFPIEKTTVLYEDVDLKLLERELDKRAVGHCW